MQQKKEVEIDKPTQIEANRKYRELNREKYNQQARARYKRRMMADPDHNKKQYRQRLTKWSTLPPEERDSQVNKYKKYTSKYYEKNKDRIKAYQRNWVEENRERVRVKRREKYREMRAAVLQLRAMRGDR